ncbi:hypothetical protein [Hafnia phage yong3]|nr:hypothetical protein [Hafnia phage yong3]UPT53034.1 hypothetical protein [Hafnia phage yong3]
MYNAIAAVLGTNTKATELTFLLDTEGMDWDCATEDELVEAMHILMGDMGFTANAAISEVLNAIIAAWNTVRTQGTANTTTFTVCFTADRHGNTARANVDIPKIVPVAQRTFAIAARLRANGYPEAHDVVIMQDTITISAVECGGLPHNVDIAAAGY